MICERTLNRSSITERWPEAGLPASLADSTKPPVLSQGGAKRHQFPCDQLLTTTTALFPMVKSSCSMRMAGRHSSSSSYSKARGTAPLALLRLWSAVSRKKHLRKQSLALGVSAEIVDQARVTYRRSLNLNRQTWPPRTMHSS